MAEKSQAIAREVQFGFLPVKKSERTLGFWDLLLVQLSIGISSFCCFTGGYTGMALNARDAIAAILLGNAIPVLLSVPIAAYFARYGIETFIGFRSALGHRGSDLLFLVFSFITIGFVSVACFMTGQSAVKIASMLNMGDFWTSSTGGAPLFAIVSFIIAYFIAYKGFAAIKWLNWIGVPAILLVLVGLISLILFGQGLGKVFALQPAAPYESWSKSFAISVELNMGIGFSWLCYLGQYSRLAKTEKIAFTAGFWSYGIFANIAAVLGALAALVAMSLDPTDWMIKIGGPILGMIGLWLLILGNISAVVFLIYSQAVSFKTVFPKQKWGAAVGTTLIAIPLMVSPAFYDVYGKFIAVISYIMGVIGAIVIIDYFFIKKQQISLSDLYYRKGAYEYWYGINPSAVLSFIMGTVVYWTLYNPLTNHPSHWFVYISAGIPAYVVSGIVYYISAMFIFPFKLAGSNFASRQVEPE